jgi:hypothetical protein
MTAKDDLGLREALALLEQIAADWRLLDGLSAEERSRFHDAIARIYNPDPVARRRRMKTEERAKKAAWAQRDDAVLNQTGIRELRRKPVFTTPNVFPPKQITSERRESLEPKHCYVCKQKYSEIHHFYDQLCPPCAELNFRKRTELADLRGRAALLTGGRVKIGYQAGLKLLRAGARLIVTTRFPRDSAGRYSREPDFAEWGDRLEIFGLDLRHTPSVEAFCRQLLQTHDRLDFIVNNACQTVRRPPEFYRHMMERERVALSGSQVRLISEIPSAPELSQVKLLPEEYLENKGLFPEGVLDQDLQQVDLRGRNSWRLLLSEVSAVEMLEVQCGCAVHPERAPEAADAAHAGARQAHRQRVRGRRPVLPQIQDNPPSAHQHGESCTEHDDANIRRGIPRQRHPHEQRRHRLGNRRGSGRNRRAQDRRATLLSAAGHRGWRGAHRRSHYCRYQFRRACVGEISQGLSADRLVGCCRSPISLRSSNAGPALLGEPRDLSLAS